MEKDTLTIYPQGDLDLVSAKKVKEQVDSLLCARNGLKMLVMNLGEVRFIDSSGRENHWTSFVPGIHFRQYFSLLMLHDYLLPFPSPLTVLCGSLWII